MQYYVIMVNDFPEHVIPGDAVPPVLKGSVPSLKQYVEYLRRELQRKLDKEDGATSSWKRRRYVHTQECGGYDYTKIVNVDEDKPVVNFIEHDSSENSDEN